MGRALPAALGTALLCASFLLLFAAAAVAEKAEPTSGLVLVARVEGVVGGAVRDYVSSALQEAEAHNAVLVLVLDTPGGNLESALDIVKEIRRSTVPVVSYVSGVWAVSAGTLILECSHIAAMQPGTIIGAMQPVAYNPTTGGYTPINESKILNPVYKDVEACMKLFGRNATLARKFVYENLVLEAEEALKVKAVDFVASSLEELLMKINGTVVNTTAGPKLLVTWPARVVEYSMPLGLRIAHFLSDPVISSIISSIAITTIVAALLTGHLHLLAVGVALLLLSLLGLGYSVNVIALVMLVTGLILLIVELVFLPGFGVVGFTGIALLVLGMIMLPVRKPTAVSPEYMRIVVHTTVAATLPLAGLMGIIVYKAIQTWRRRPAYQPTLIGEVGHAVDDIEEEPKGFVMVRGELWRARTRSGRIPKGSKVRVVGKDGAVLIVEPYSGEEG